MSLRIFSIPAFCRVCAAIAVAAAMAAHAQPADTDFIAARDAFQAGDAQRLEKVAPRLKGHLLEAYVGYWQLRLRLDDADPERVRAFLKRSEGMPLADRLRSEWLKSLGKRGLWDLFAEEYPSRVDSDVELTCYAVQWRRTQRWRLRARGRTQLLVQRPAAGRGMPAAFRSDARSRLAHDQ